LDAFTNINFIPRKKGAANKEKKLGCHTGYLPWSVCGKQKQPPKDLEKDTAEAWGTEYRSPGKKQRREPSIGARRGASMTAAPITYSLFMASYCASMTLFCTCTSVSCARARSRSAVSDLKRASLLSR